MTGVEPATSRVKGEVTVVYTTAKSVPGICDKGCEPLRDITVGERSNPCLSPRPKLKAGSLHPAKVVPREVLAPSSPALQAGARAISAIEGQMVSRAGIEPARRSTGFSAHACLPNSTTWTYWCPPRESNSHAFRAAVFEAAASACSARRAKNGAAHRSRTCTDRVLGPDPLPVGVVPRLPRRESNAQGCV